MCVSLLCLIENFKRWIFDFVCFHFVFDIRLKWSCFCDSNNPNFNFLLFTMAYCVCRDYEESRHELLCVEISKFRLEIVKVVMNILDSFDQSPESRILS